MSPKNSHALGYLGVFSFGMFLLGLIYQMLIAGRGLFGAIFMALIFAGIIAAIIYLFMMTTHGMEWSKAAAKTIETKAGEVKAKAGEVKAKVEQAREASAAEEEAPAPVKVEEPEAAAPVTEEPAPAPSAPIAEEKPAALEGPEGGTADDLKKIKGVGPKLEQVLHGMGYYHFHQIAAWGDKEVAWVDENLEGFKGRVSRDNWVAQAKELAG